MKNLSHLDDADLFTGVLFNNYGPPNGFCFDILCDDEPIIDDKHSPDYNVDRRVSLGTTRLLLHSPPTLKLDFFTQKKFTLNT